MSTPYIIFIVVSAVFVLLFLVLKLKIMAPLIHEMNLPYPHRALVVLAIASGATLLSHVNDSGF
jgi:preprotein translocase subunit SecD